MSRVVLYVLCSESQSSINSNGWVLVREHEVTFGYLEQQ
jgi:hypothetical protein